MVTVAQAESMHAEALAELAEEMARFYGAPQPDPLELRIRQINESLFADPPSAYAILAWDGGRLVGFAAYSFLWPAVGLTRSVYLKELYVAETARHKGVGRLLIQYLYEMALRNECSRVEWTTDRDNPDAQRFYAQLGVPVKESKVFYRVEGEELRRLTAQPLPPARLLAVGAAAGYGEPVGVNGEAVLRAGTADEVTEHVIGNFGHRAAFLADEVPVSGGRQVVGGGPVSQAGGINDAEPLQFLELAVDRGQVHVGGMGADLGR